MQKLKPQETIRTSNFGEPCDYWMKFRNEVYVSNNVYDLINILPEDERIIDPVGIVSLSRFNYVAGNRTLIKGIHKCPWHANLNGKGELTRDALLPHGNDKQSPEVVAVKFKELLKKEISDKIKGKSKIVLLLTGGLDSRITAGILNEIQQKEKLNIEAVTWGMETSRDIQYAKDIAGWFGWEHKTLDYTSDLTWDNVQRGINWAGGEIIGIHLHAMNYFENVDSDSVVLASSFGDSIGRAEFSGNHILKSGLPNLFNRGGLFIPYKFDKWKEKFYADRALAWNSDDNVSKGVKIEHDQQENYMRRQLSHAMNYINQYTDLYQVFTAPEVVKFIWSLDFTCRTDDVYTEMFRNMDERLYNLPWARTGIAPSGAKCDRPNLTKEYHQLRKWLRDDHLEEIKTAFFSDEIKSLNIYSQKGLNDLWKNWELDESVWGEDVLKVYALAQFMDKYKIKSTEKHSIIAQKKHGLIFRLKSIFK